MHERRSESGIPLEAVYGPADRTDADYARRLGDPGEFPYTRGVRAPSGRRGGWIQRELSGEGDPRRSNAQFRFLLSKGQTGLDVIGDTPTVACLDPDHPLARHAVGTQGVSLCRLQDYRELYADLPLDRVTLSHSIPALFAVAGLACVARERGVPPAALRGSVIQAPYYCEDTGYATQLPFELRVRMAVDSIAFCASEMPKFHAFLEDTYYISDGGLDAIEEMALGFVEIRGLVRELLARGVPVDRFAPRIGILVNCRMDLFEEIAKVRATRRLFARMMRDEFGARDPRSLAVNVTAHTSGMALTAQQPVNNVVRGSLQALAMALAGVQAMEVSAFDEAFRTPSPQAHEVALRTQQIIHLESNVTQVADPLGGSYFLEALTDEIERRIRAMVEQVEGLGEPAALAERGWFRSLFQNAMERHARALADGSLPKVGVNCHVVPEEEDTLLREVAELKIEPYVERIDAIRRHREERDAGRVQESLAALRARAEDRRANLTPAVIAAFEAGATMGEMAEVLRLAYGWPADPWLEGPLGEAASA
jgi:methylmalonyl-CoA mutase N-terminal domain/subunit